jgi:hypothetical protein
MSVTIRPNTERRTFIIHLSYLLSYFLVTWAVYLLTSSFITFFHLQLDHTLTVVENWNQDQGWEIASFVKIISFCILLKFISIRSISRRPLRDFFVTYFRLPNKRLFSLIIFTLFFSVLTFGPVLANRVSFEISKVFSSYLGSFIYLSIDIVLFLFIHSIYPLKKKKRIIEAIFYICLIYYLNIKIFSHSDVSHFALVYFMAIGLRLSFWKKLNWSYCAIFLSLAACPLITFMGLDFIWGSDYSYMVTNSRYGNIIFTVLLFVSYGYIEISESRLVDRLTKA